VIHVVDISGAIPAAYLGAEGVIAGVIPDIVEAIVTEIKRLAGTRLGSTGEDYVQGVQPPVYHFRPGALLPPPGSPVATVVLAGWLPNAVENGWAGGDMKTWMLAGRNAKVGKDGKRYNTVPFRHMGPGASGRDAPPMGSAHGPTPAAPSRRVGGGMTAEDAARLGRRVLKAAKALSATTSHPDTGTTWGGRLEAGLAPILRPHHKTDIYAGMVRQEKTYRAATQNQYTTFRRISENSDPEAWVHPGIEGRHLFREAADYANVAASDLIGRAFRAFARGAAP